MKKKLKHLKSSALFKDIKKSDLEKLTPYINEEYFGKNNIVFDEDDQGDSLYVIYEGSIKISIKTEWRIQSEELISIFRPEEIFGELSFLDKCRRSATAIALEDTILLSLSRADFKKFGKKHSFLAFNLMINLGAILTDKLRKTNMLWRRTLM